MTDEIESAPERIWAAPSPHGGWAEAYAGDWPSPANRQDTPYVRKDVYDALRQRAEKAEAALRELCADCTCPPAYSERGMQDPECPAGNYGDLAREALGLPPACQHNRAALRRAEEGRPMTDEIKAIKRDRDAGTPGPWKWTDDIDYQIKAESGPYIANVYVCEVTEQAESDARRIARVPELEHVVLSVVEAVANAEQAEKAGAPEVAYTILKVACRQALGMEEYE